MSIFHFLVLLRNEKLTYFLDNGYLYTSTQLNLNRSVNNNLIDATAKHYFSLSSTMIGNSTFFQVIAIRKLPIQTNFGFWNRMAGYRWNSDLKIWWVLSNLLIMIYNQLTWQILHCRLLIIKNQNNIVRFADDTFISKSSANTQYTLKNTLFQTR